MASTTRGPGQHNRWRGTGLSWSLLAGLILGTAVIIGIVQNGQNVEVRYLVWTGHAALAVLLLVTIVATVALTALAGVVWRWNRRRLLVQRAELEHLRAVTQAQAAPPPPPAV